MKMNVFIFLLAFITSCGNNNETVDTIEPKATEVVENDEEQQNMIVGKFKKEDLQEGQYATWFNAGYEEYSPSEEAMETIKNNISEYEIVGIMGTWCPDSRREVPHFFKILDEAGYNLDKLTMIGVDRSKSTPENLEEGYEMTRVPTFIFMKDGKEVNRYVEYAREDMDSDIAAIVSGEDYTNSYAN